MNEVERAVEDFQAMMHVITLPPVADSMVTAGVAIQEAVATLDRYGVGRRSACALLQRLVLEAAFPGEE
jgi:hypothetical protein